MVSPHVSCLELPWGTSRESGLRIPGGVNWFQLIWVSGMC